MPTYDYYCDENGRTVEVKHGMREELGTWRQLCELAGIAEGDTPAQSPVRKLATGGQVVKSSSLKNQGGAPACAMQNSCCGGGVCGLID